MYNSRPVNLFMPSMDDSSTQTLESDISSRCQTISTCDLTSFSPLRPTTISALTSFTQSAPQELSTTRWYTLELIDAYEHGVTYSYRFLAPDFFLRFSGPFKTRRDEQAYRADDRAYETHLDAVPLLNNPAPPRLNQINSPLNIVGLHMLPQIGPELFLFILNNAFFTSTRILPLLFT